MATPPPPIVATCVVAGLDAPADVPSRGSDGGSRGASMTVSGTREDGDFAKKLKKNSIHLNPRVPMALSQDADAHTYLDCPGL